MKSSKEKKEVVLGRIRESCVLLLALCASESSQFCFSNAAVLLSSFRLALGTVVASLLFLDDLGELGIDLVRLHIVDGGVLDRGVEEALALLVVAADAAQPLHVGPGGGEGAHD